MNVLIIEDHASSKKGGAERSMRYFCEYLSKMENLNVYFIYHVPGDLVNGENKAIYKDCTQINLYPVGHVGFFSWIKSTYLLMRYCKRHKIDVVFTHVIHAFYTIRISKIFCSFKFIQYFKWVASTPDIGFWGRWGLRGVNEAYAVSKYTMEYWKILNPAFKNSNIVPDGIPEKAQSIKSKSRISHLGKTKQLLFAGRIYEGKGLHILIEAISKTRAFDINLIVCGNFNTHSQHPDLDYHIYLENLINKYNLNDKILFLGFVADISTYITESDLVIVPSIWPDAQPLVLLEAMRSKRLCIASKIGGIPEILNEHLSVLLFAPNDSTDLSKKIEIVLDTSPIDILKVEKKLFDRFKTCYILEKTNKILFEHIKNVK